MNDTTPEKPDVTKRTMRSSGILFGGLAIVGLLVGYRRYTGSDCCAGGEAHAAVTQAPSASMADNANATLPAAKSIDERFEGCQASCGSRSPAMRAAARAQPGAALGDVVHCPVSGAVFRIKEDATKREVLGKPIYFCCASCAAYFDAHRAQILTARGIPFGGA